MLTRLFVFGMCGCAVLAPVSAPISFAVPAARTGVLSVEFSKDAYGRSGALQIRTALPGERIELPVRWDDRPQDAWYRWIPVLGTSARTQNEPFPQERVARAPEQPGIYELEVGSAEASRRLGEVKFVVKVPFDRKQGQGLGGYNIGRYPTEGSRRSDRYAPPSGFIEVTRENQNLQLSEHFVLREFLTHDQKGVWPKYAVVEPRLIEKLELVMSELNAMGIPARRFVVMSGFRTPQYNRRGLSNGRAVLSRHQYGDAADVWVDNNADNYMDDLNRDGRRDTRDARVMLSAVNRVEARYGDMIGGAGIYRDNGAHGPFIHIDVRGRPARWGAK
jgi:hypothetical protein